MPSELLPVVFEESREPPVLFQIFQTKGAAMQDWRSATSMDVTLPRYPISTRSTCGNAPGPARLWMMGDYRWEGSEALKL